MKIYIISYIKINIITWVQFHSEAVVWPRTNEDKLEENGVLGRPSKPQALLNTGEDDYLEVHCYTKKDKNYNQETTLTYFFQILKL